MSEKLKPCPFCGGPAHSTPEIHEANMAALIMCSDNDCVTLDRPTIVEAVEAWNRRHQEQEASSEFERMMK